MRAVRKRVQNEQIVAKQARSWGAEEWKWIWVLHGEAAGCPAAAVKLYQLRVLLFVGATASPTDSKRHENLFANAVGL